MAWFGTEMGVRGMGVEEEDGPHLQSKPFALNTVMSPPAHMSAQGTFPPVSLAFALLTDVISRWKCSVCPLLGVKMVLMHHVSR